MKTINFTNYKNKLTELMNGTDEQHSQYIYNQGLKWLDNYFGQHNSVMIALEKEWSYSATFWNWWKLQYNVRCYEIMMMVGLDLEINTLNKLQKEALIECFNFKHNKAINIYPSMAIQLKIQDTKKEIEKKELVKL